MRVFNCNRGKSVVTDFVVSLVDQNVGRFDVSMPHIRIVEQVKASENLYEEFSCFNLSESFLLLHMLFKIPMSTVLHHDIKIISRP